MREEAKRASSVRRASKRYENVADGFFNILLVLAESRSIWIIILSFF